MSYIFQNRKNNLKYSSKKRKEYWIAIDPDAPGLPVHKYPVGSKVEANAELLRVERRAAAIKYGIILDDVLITEILDSYFNQKTFSKPKRMKNVIEYLKKPFEGIHYCDLTKSMYFEKRALWTRVKKEFEGQPLAKNSVVGFEKIFRAAIRFHDPANNIFKGKRIKFVPVQDKGFRDMPIPDNHLQMIVSELDRIPDLGNDLEYLLARSLVAFLKILRYTGMRNGALQKLPKCKVGFKSNTIKISCSLSKPNSGDYEVPIDGRIFEVLTYRMTNSVKIVNDVLECFRMHKGMKFNRLNDFEKNKIVKAAHDALFPEAVLFPHYYFKIQALFKKVIRKLNLPEYHFHDLRHSAATEWYLKSHDIKKVSLALGHKSIAITQYYIKKLMVNVSSCFHQMKTDGFSSAA